MSKASDRQAASSAEDLLVPPGPPSPEAMSRIMQPAMSANATVLEMNARLFHVAAEASRGWFDFMSRRLEKDAAFAEKLRGAKDPEGLMSAYSEFYQTAAQDYQQEFSELMSLHTKAANSAGEAVKDASQSMMPSGGPSRGDGSGS